VLTNRLVEYAMAEGVVTIFREELEANAHFTTGRNFRCIEQSRPDEDVEIVAVETAGFDLSVDDVERIVGRHRWFVRPVAGHNRVVNVADGHDARLGRDVDGGDLVGIARAIKTFMMLVRNLRNLFGKRG